MEEVRTLKGITGKTAPGRAPDYTPAHLLYALSLLNERRIGRKQLSEEIRVGEGTVRTIISRLSDEGLIVVSRPGISLTPRGVSFLERVLNRLSWCEYPSTDLTVAESNCIVLISGASDGIRYGVEQRDQALIHGAVGATTLIMVEGRWVMPGTDEEVELTLPDAMVSKDGDVVIIGSGDDEFTARLGALSAALQVLV
jgi:DNA-binding MarR family transcriptional regulator